MRRQQWLSVKIWKMPVIATLLLLLSAGMIIGLIGCGGDSSSSSSDTPTNPSSKQCETLDQQCWACEDAALRAEPSCANAVSCAESDDFWGCINTMLGDYSACEQAIDRTCYDATSNSVCMQAWKGCAVDACDAASAKAWACDQQVLFQNAACAGASQCFWDEDLWTCLENTLGEYSACEMTLVETCYQEGSPDEEYWKACEPEHYACSKQTLNACSSWLQEQPMCTANDQRLIKACQASDYLYSKACYQQFDELSDDAWTALESRADCQFDACDYLLQ